MQEALRRFKADIFSALSHPTRIAIIELLHDGEKSAGAILDHLQVEQANASQHLAVLRARQIVMNRKEGNQVFYSLRSQRLVEVLDSMRRYFEEYLADSLELLQEVQREPAASSHPVREESAS